MSHSSLLVEPVLGWRLWHVLEAEDGPRLLSWSRRAEWPARRRLEARCGRLLSRAAHEAPRPGHTCGIYAVGTREAAVELLQELPRPLLRPVAVGRVSLWGRMVENVGGWRAQYAYPYELFVTGGGANVLQGLRRRYAVDVAPL